jgi:hypothetical protein
MEQSRKKGSRLIGNILIRTSMAKKIRIIVKKIFPIIPMYENNPI